jgi:glutathionylspermidine synthase
MRRSDRIPHHLTRGSLNTATFGLVRDRLRTAGIANITLVRDNTTVVSTPGRYKGKQICQALAPAAVFDNRHTVLGLWMIDQDCCGMGVRESFSPITGNLSSFVPRFFS